MYFIYNVILYILMPFVLLRMVWLGRKTAAYKQQWRQRFGHVRLAVTGERPIWIHAVSVGEVQVSRPLVEYLRRQYPDIPIVITTVTPTGAFTVAQAYADSGNVHHSYFPYDLPSAVRRFLHQLKPGILIVLETEIWPNLYRQCRQAGVPLLLLNARLSEKSMKGYSLLKSLTRSTLECTDVIAVQTEQDAARFIKIGAPAGKVTVTGNLKFDINLPRGVMEQGELVRQKLSASRPIWMAASTHQGEEQLVLEALAQVLTFVHGSLLIIAPRHPQRFDAVYDLCIKQGYRTARYTVADSYSTTTQILLLDVLGQLPVYYAASDLAFVGGSLVPIGGHNMLEPASLGLPVLTGNHIFNFSEVVSLLENGNALVRVDSSAQLGRKVVELLQDGNLRDELGQRARQVVNENHGSINRVASLLQQYIKSTVD